LGGLIACYSDFVIVFCRLLLTLVHTSSIHLKINHNIDRYVPVLVKSAQSHLLIKVYLLTADLLHIYTTV